MNESIPIVFFHIGNHDYFKSAVSIALRKNKVIHIGDSLISNHKDYKFVDYKTVSDKFEEFSKIYVHLSSNPHTYELVCFLRWISLMNLMKKENIKNAYYSDSDVANFDDMTLAFDELGKPSVSYVVVKNDSEYRWSACGLSSFWNLETITSMVNFMFDCYQSEEMRGKLMEKMNWHAQSGTPGGVCDMTIFYLYSTKHNVLPLNQEIAGSTFDQNINDSENFERNEYQMNNGIKKIHFQDSSICGTTTSGKAVRFRTLHCQGSSKHIMMQIEGLAANAFK